MRTVKRQWAPVGFRLLDAQDSFRGAIYGRVAGSRGRKEREVFRYYLSESRHLQGPGVRSSLASERPIDRRPGPFVSRATETLLQER